MQGLTARWPVAEEGSFSNSPDSSGGLSLRRAAFPTAWTPQVPTGMEEAPSTIHQLPTCADPKYLGEKPEVETRLLAAQDAGIHWYLKTLPCPFSLYSLTFRDSKITSY